MQRNVILPIAGGIVAALILVGAILLIGHRHKTTELTISTPPPSESIFPSVSPSASPTVSPSASPSPSPSASASASAAPNGSPKATAKPTPTPHPVRSVSSVNCDNTSDARYCSAKDETVYTNGSFTKPANPPPPSYPDSATITTQSTAQNGTIHVVVTIQNKTSKTFHFPTREIDLVMLKDNKSFDTLKTSGPGFDMAPGTKMTGTFDSKEITQNGTYSWQAKTWYYVK